MTADKTEITHDSVIADDLASAVIELRRLGMHLPINKNGDADVATRLFTYAEMIQAMLPLVESLEKKGRALL